MSVPHMQCTSTHTLVHTSFDTHTTRTLVLTYTDTHTPSAHRHIDTHTQRTPYAHPLIPIKRQLFPHIQEILALYHSIYTS